MLYYITGAELDVKNANISGERTSILKSNGHFSRSKISHDTPAKTKFPNFYEHEGIIYLDCPGLGDTNRYEKDQLFELSENAKVVLLLSAENLSDKGEKFIALLSKLKHLLGNFDDVKDALSFVITKASLGYDIQNFRAWINNTVIPQQNHTGFTTEFHEKMLSYLSSEDSRIGLFLKHDESSFINDIIKLNLKIIKESINASTAARGLKVQFELSNESKVIGKELVKHIETYLSKRSDNSINITLNTINTPKDQQAHKALKIIENLKKYLIFREQIIKNQQMLDTLGISASDTEFFDKIEHLNHDSDIIYKKNVESQRQEPPQLDKDYDNRSRKATALVKHSMLTLFQIEEFKSLLKCDDQKLQKELLQHTNNATQTIFYTLQSSATNIFDKKKKETFISAQNNKEIAIPHAAPANSDDSTNQPPHSNSSPNDTLKPPNNLLQLLNLKHLLSEALKALLSPKDVKSAFGRFAPRKVHPDKENCYNRPLSKLASGKKVVEDLDTARQEYIWYT